MDFAQIWTEQALVSNANHPLSLAHPYGIVRPLLYKKVRGSRCVHASITTFLVNKKNMVREHFDFLVEFYRFEKFLKFLSIWEISQIDSYQFEKFLKSIEIWEISQINRIRQENRNVHRSKKKLAKNVVIDAWTQRESLTFLYNMFPAQISIDLRNFSN